MRFQKLDLNLLVRQRAAHRSHGLQLRGHPVSCRGHGSHCHHACPARANRTEVPAADTAGAAGPDAVVRDRAGDAMAQVPHPGPGADLAARLDARGRCAYGRASGSVTVDRIDHWLQTAGFRRSLTLRRFRGSIFGGNPYTTARCRHRGSCRPRPEVETPPERSRLSDEARICQSQ